MKTILILCTGNSCRSQMAEAYMRFFLGEKAVVKSAGITPSMLHPLAVQVMKEDGIDMSDQLPCDVQELTQHRYDYVITVCENALAHLPEFIDGKEYLHWPVDDPADAQGNSEEQLEIFRTARENVKVNVLRFVGRAFPLPLMATV